MSLAREGLRAVIRTTAAPAMLIYIAMKMWTQIKDKPGTRNLVETYKKLWIKLTTKIKQLNKTQGHD